ncbi:hypothetical protein GRF29_69g575260 [Pseudopithomyces chartarum]|uniref:Uncharacterized protein n=1 Tax=Pseudopithomyces chartarum TaxID=1892770 RepID=A0AAN6RHM8_9PLEO|nr:hypothetical protein GRF29_69g575260 [Pseudopithomyces chartarum]
MRAAARLLASVKNGRYLEPGTPTGLCGLLTHPSPRSALLYHYTATLDKLQQIPESSVYRQATEALTRHRLKIIEEAEPVGWQQWQQTIQDKIESDPDAFTYKKTSAGTVATPPAYEEFDPRSVHAAWDGEAPVQFPAGIRTQAERAPHVKAFKGDANYSPERTINRIKLPSEPQYTVEAISELENRLGGGLIEEVIQVAEGEHKLVDEMIKHKVWEPLEEPAPEGQWKFFERGFSGHTKTQHP